MEPSRCLVELLFGRLSTKILSQYSRHALYSASTMEPSMYPVGRGSFGEAESALCPPDHCPSTLYGLVQESTKIEGLKYGRRLHCLIIASGFESSSKFTSALIRLFAVCGCLSEVNQVFWRVPTNNVFAWTALITAYTRLGHHAKAITLHCAMQIACVEPDGHTFVALLKACGSSSAWAQGRLIHAYVTEMGMEADLFIGNTLVDMYAKAGCMENSLRIFRTFRNKDITTWNSVISGFFHCGHVLKAFDVFEQLHKEKGVESNIVTWNSVVAGCVHFGLLEEAFECFMRIQQRGLLPDIITWNSLLYGYVQHSYGEETLQFFRQMQLEGIGLDSVTFMCVFKACSSLLSLSHGKFLHSQMMGTGIVTSVLVESTLTDMYAKCGDLKKAIEVFTCRLLKKDLVSWNTIIAGHLHHALYQESFQFFEQMLHEGIIPSQVTFVLMLKACSASGYLYEGCVLHSYITECSCDSGKFVGSALIDLYMKCGKLRDARVFFNRMHTRGLVTWSALVAGYAWHGYAEEASWLIQKMQQDGIKPTVVTWNGLIRGCAYNRLCTETFVSFQNMLIDEVEPNEATFVSVFSACLGPSDLNVGEFMYTYIVEGGWENSSATRAALINMYANLGLLEASLGIFDGKLNQGIHVWGAMLEAFVQHQCSHEAIQLCQRMQQEGLFLTQAIIVSALKACIGARLIYQSKVVHVQALELGFESNKLVGHSLINVYTKCGSLKDAWNAFYKIQKRDEVTWSAMVEACAEHADYKLALLCFQGMQVENLDPNEVSFLSLLSVCSHTGLSENACLYFGAMITSFGIAPSFTHYTCMADLFGRAGRLVEADDLLHTMPFGPNLIGFLSVLNHCKTYGNYYVGKTYFNRTYNAICQHYASDDFMSESISTW